MSYFGNMVEGELNQVEGSGASLTRNRQMILDSYFKAEDAAPTPGMYADPALLFGGT